MTDCRYCMLEAVVGLEPLPTSAIDLAMIAAEPDGAVGDVVEVLDRDQALIGSGMAQANSADQASQRTIGTARDAVLGLGVARVAGIAMFNAMSGSLDAEIAFSV